MGSTLATRPRCAVTPCPVRRSVSLLPGALGSYAAARRSPRARRSRLALLLLFLFCNVTAITRASAFDRVMDIDKRSYSYRGSQCHMPIAMSMSRCLNIFEFLLIGTCLSVPLLLLYYYYIFI